jgi:ABC-2 type transport system ATP-binding protein
MSKTPALELKGLTRRYGDLVALGPVDLRIPTGQRVSLIGANGSGKTTFLRLVSGLLEATEGTIEIQGEPVGSLEARAEVSYIPDDPVLYEDLSARGEQLMEKLNNAHRQNDLPSGFSRGLRQKTSLAIGFLRPYSILMVDEPFVGLDEPGRHALLDLLDEASAAGNTVIVASHQLELVERAERCIALSDGAIAYDGEPKKAEIDKLIGF